MIITQWHTQPEGTYPVAGEAPKRGAPRKYPEVVIFDCPACKKNRVSTDPEHTRRSEPPLICRHPDVAPIEWSCPGCKAHRPMTHASHTHVDGECRLPGTRIAHGRSRGSGPVRDPAVPASGEPRGRRRLTGPDLDGDPNALPGPLAPHPREENSGPASGSGGGDAPAPRSAPPTPPGPAPATPPLDPAEIPEEEGMVKGKVVFDD